MHPNSQMLFEKYAKSLFTPGLRVLEVGPDAFPSSYRKIVNNDAIQWETIDTYESDKLTHRATRLVQVRLPPPRQQLRHRPVRAGDRAREEDLAWMPGLSRVCKKGGLVVTINPVSWPFTNTPLTAGDLSRRNPWRALRRFGADDEAGGERKPDGPARGRDAVFPVQTDGEGADRQETQLSLHHLADRRYHLHRDQA